MTFPGFPDSQIDWPSRSTIWQVLDKYLPTSCQIIIDFFLTCEAFVNYPELSQII